MQCLCIPEKFYFTSSSTGQFIFNNLEDKLRRHLDPLYNKVGSLVMVRVNDIVLRNSTIFPDNLKYLVEK